jgi:type II secretion system protein J
MRRGFTLLELVLATSLAALIAVGALQYLESARDLGARVEFKSQMFQTARAILTLMERDIQCAYASGNGLDWGLRGTDTNRGDYPADVLELVASNNRPKSEERKECDLTRTTYAIEPERGLLRQKTKELTTSGTIFTTTGLGDVISSQVVGLDMRFHDGAMWSPSWDSTTLSKMPKAIEITLIVKAKFHEREETDVFTAAVWLPVGQTYEAPPQ